ncbi:MAG: hypothetical protein K2Y28_06405 [Burkholderiaceae bacterium]|nr:hypothetical protein [Burkholderiaceae bacterium]
MNSIYIKNGVKSFVFVIFLFFVIFALQACGEREQVDLKDDSNVNCKRGTNPVGPPIYYPEASPRSEQKSMDSWEEWKTTAGYTMRIPAGVGGVSHRSEKCEMAAAIFEFKWVDGKLLSYYDLKTGYPRTEGTWVKYFVSFNPPVVDGVKSYIYRQWKFGGAFKIPEHEKIWLLPYGSVADPKYIPADRENPKNFRPAIMLEDAPDPAGNGAIFYCDPIKLKPNGNRIDVEVVYRDSGTNCQGYVYFAYGSGGRLDIFGDHFFDIATPITNAVTAEIKSYIVKD